MKKLLLAFVTFVISTSIAIAAVNLNTATKEDLDKVKGIGPVKAQAIIDYRKKNGPFKNVDELENVKGFGGKSVKRVRSELTVNGVANAKSTDTKTTDTKPTDKKHDAKK
jgi:competence protein ComEA